MTASDDILERAKQIDFDVVYRKSDCEGRHWVKIDAFYYDEMKECIPKLIAMIEECDVENARLKAVRMRIAKDIVDHHIDILIEIDRLREKYHA